MKGPPSLGRRSFLFSGQNASPLLFDVGLNIAICVTVFSAFLPTLQNGFVRPVLGLFQTGPQLVADRYSYLARLGFALLAGGVLFKVATFPNAHRFKRQLVGVALILILSPLAVLTWRHIGVWQSSRRLWTHAVAVSPSAVAYSQLGVSFADEERFAEAIENFRRALEINPRYVFARVNLGSALGLTGRLDEAVIEFTRALEVDPEDRTALHNLQWASVLRQRGGS